MGKNSGDIGGGGVPRGGDLFVYLVEGRNMKGRDRFSRSDPYVLMRLGFTGQVRRSRTHNEAGANCHFNENFTFDVPAHVGDSLRLSVQVFDSNTGADKLIGEATIDLQHLTQSKGTSARDDQWYSIIDKNGKNAGQLRMDLNYTPKKAGGKAMVGAMSAQAAVNHYQQSYGYGPQMPAGPYPGQQYPYGQPAPAHPGMPYGAPAPAAYGAPPPAAYGAPPYQPPGGAYGPPPSGFGQPGAPAYSAPPSYGQPPPATTQPTPPGYPQQQHQPPAPGYPGAPPQPAYPPQPGYPAQQPPGYPAQPGGYPPQPHGYPPQSGYPPQPGYR